MNTFSNRASEIPSVCHMTSVGDPMMSVFSSQHQVLDDLGVGIQWGPADDMFPKGASKAGV